MNDFVLGLIVGVICGVGIVTSLIKTNQIESVKAQQTMPPTRESRPREAGGRGGPLNNGSYVDIDGNTVYWEYYK